MRRFVLPVAVVLAVAGAAPAFADGGLPELANLHVGSFTAALHNDSPTLVTGSNSLTVEVPALPDRHAVSLSLSGPHGQRLDVPLRAVQVLDGAADEHSGHTHAHDMAAMADSHAQMYVARGSVSVPEAGTWQARLTIRQNGGESFAAEAPLIADEGGPNRLYLAGTGALIGGFVVYGATQRRRLTPTSNKAR